MAEMVPWTGAVPRRARHLIPLGLPRRGEILAVSAVAIVVAHLLLAQLTLVLAVVFIALAKVSRWRLWWLLAPAAAGLAWALALGLDRAFAGFTAGPSGILWHLAGGQPAGEAWHPLAGFAGVRDWLPRQFPVALVCGAAEAALAGWLDWLHTDEWAVPPPRPGLVAAARRTLARHAIRTGAVVTRDGCALGVVPSTGAIAELRWAELTRGALVAGAAQQAVTLAGLQVVHAALRRRKPVIVFSQGDPGIARALAAACRATGTPLLTAELGRVTRDRLATLLPAQSAELAGRAWAELTALAADLRRIGVDGDMLVWVPRGEQVPAQGLASLLGFAPDIGMSLLIGTTSPRAAAELSALVGSVLSYRVADRQLAERLAAVAGTRLRPAPVAAALGGTRPAAGPSRPASPPSRPHRPHRPSPEAVVPPDLVPSPALPAQAVLSLGPAEFVLAASWPRQRLIATAAMVPAGLPRGQR